MNRRALLIASGSWATLAASFAPAQPADDPRKIGWLSPFSTNRGKRGAAIEAFTLRLKELGQVEGRDVSIEARASDGNAERLPALARELVALHPAVIVAVGNSAVAAAMGATRDIPIVMYSGISPVELGYVESLARPGGNVTGTTYNQPEIGGKIVEVIKAAAPRATRVTSVFNPDFPGMTRYRPSMERAAKGLGVILTHLEVRRPGDFSIERLLRGRPDAVFLALDSAVLAHRSEILRFAFERKLPAFGVSREFAEAGGLLSLSPDPRELRENTAGYVDRILRGARPADLPVQEPTKFELIINLRTAKAIGLTLAQSLLLRADEVIE